MLVGYMRVSTDGDRQVLDLQRDALLAAGVDERHLFEDRASGSRDDSRRPGQGAGLHPRRRLPGGLEVGSARSIPAASVDHGDRPQGTRCRVPVSDRADRHHHTARRAAVPHLRGIGAVRAGADPGARSGRARRGAPSWPSWRPSRRDRRGETRRGDRRTRRRRHQGSGLPHLRRQAQHAHRLAGPYRLVCRSQRIRRDKWRDGSD